MIEFDIKEIRMIILQILREIGKKESKHKGWNEIKTNDSWAIFKIMGEFVNGYEKLSKIGPCNDGQSSFFDR